MDSFWSSYIIKREISVPSGGQARSMFKRITWTHGGRSWWGYPGITEQEISDITRGPLRLGFVRINDSLFFLLKAGNNPWFDAPYEPRFKMNQLDYQTNIPEGKGAPMLICAVDTASGELKEMRVISLGHLQSEHLHQHCRELDQKRPMNPSTYNMMVDRIYQQYPSSDLMARLIRAEDIIMIP